MKSIFKSIWAVVLLVMVLLMFAGSARATGSYTYRLNLYTNAIAGTTSGTNLNATNSSAATAIEPGVGANITVSYTTTNGIAGNTASNVWVGFNFSSDGTNYTTTPPLYVTNTLGSNTTIICSWQETAATLNNYAFMRCDANGTTQSNQTVTINWVEISYFK